MPNMRQDAHALILLGELIDVHHYAVDEILHALADVCTARQELAGWENNAEAFEAWKLCKLRVQKLADQLTKLGRARP